MSYLVMNGVIITFRKLCSTYNYFLAKNYEKCLQRAEFGF